MGQVVRADHLRDAIDDAIAAKQNARGRAHLGASLIGHACERHLWYVFRHCETTEHSGRLLRLFERGQREEAEMNAWLRAAGLTVWAVDEDTGQQWRIEDVAGHFGGSLDGVLIGVPGYEDQPMVSEQKTHNEKSWTDVDKKGVKESKPQHFSQMQVYMHQMKLPYGLYQAVNKNNDQLYLEIVPYDQAHAESMLRRAHDVITSDRPLMRLSDNPSWYECKWCDHHAICHLDKVPAVSCRTCVDATPRMDGDGLWWCEKHDRALSLEDQRVACQAHRYIPPLLESWASVESADDTVVTYTNTKNGRTFSNGPGGYASSELAAADPAVIGAPATDQLRAEFDGRLTG